MNQLLLIQQLDYEISKYAETLYTRAGGTLHRSYHDSIEVSNQDLYKKCYQRALHKLTKGQPK